MFELSVAKGGEKGDRPPDDQMHGFSFWQNLNRRQTSQQ